MLVSVAVVCLARGYSLVGASEGRRMSIYLLDTENLCI